MGFLKPPGIGLDPVQVVGHPNVDSGHVHLSATDTPGHHTDQLPGAISLAHHRTTAVSLASVLALLSAGANEAWIQFVAVSQASAAQLLLTLLLTNDWHIHLLEDVLVLAKVTECVFAPSGGPTTSSSVVREFIRQTGWTDVRRGGKVYRSVESNDGQIVVQGTGIVFRMNGYGDHIAFDVREELDVMINIPFAQADTQIKLGITEETKFNKL